MQVRRMSQTVKDSIVAAGLAMQQAETKMPQAVITGSGLGVVGDTEKFLGKMIDNNEEFLTPTSFIQSTHNTPAAHIAARLGCNAYNLTYVNRGHSFENALQDAAMLIAEGKSNILVGGSDEMTDQYFNIIRKDGSRKNHIPNDADFFNSTSPGAVCGEGTNFFVLADTKSSLSQSKLKGLHTFTKPENTKAVTAEIQAFLNRHSLKPEALDLVLEGYSGDRSGDAFYHFLNRTIFKHNRIAGFKHLCGEYHTASSFALWLANALVKTQSCPDFITTGEQVPENMQNILIVNHFFNINHSLMLVSKT